ncbi:MAG: hydroxymethylglutaryl-CoA lyase [Flavobacteriales bacterium]
MKIIECPRDAMQGIETFIPTEQKVRYLQTLLDVGFHTLDMGAFVSPKAVPQMQDTGEVIEHLELSAKSSELLVIVANERGAKDACRYEKVRYLGYPFSISETFQQRNTNAGIEESLERLRSIAGIAEEHGKEVVVYISMGFGNPYGDTWSPTLASEWTRRLVEEIGVRIVSLADTVGVADPATVRDLFSELIPNYPDVEFGAHFHTRPDAWKANIEAAYSSGCRRFDAALKGFGGCPMAEDELVGNMATEDLISFMDEKGDGHGLDREAFSKAAHEALRTFPV